MHLKLPPSPRILIVRLSAIGDVIHGLPVACALRERFPAATIGWVVEGRTADLLRGHPAIDRLIVVRRKWLASPTAVMDLATQLRAEKFDIAIDLQCLTKSAIAARLSGARMRIGFDGPDGRELSRWLNNTRVRPTRTHVVDRNLELLEPLGIESPAIEFNLPQTNADAATVDAHLAANQITGRFALINPGAGWPSKLWPAERFAAVARHLGQRGVPSLIVWAGSDERALADRIAGAAAGNAAIAPPTSLTELAALARRASLFISSDTGPLHLAAAVGTPCVGLFGPMPAERNGPYGSQHIAIQKMRLEGTSRLRRTAGPESMEAITVAHVCRACDTILGRPGSIRRAC